MSAAFVTVPSTYRFSQPFVLVFLSELAQSQEVHHGSPPSLGAAPAPSTAPGTQRLLGRFF